MAPMPPTRPTLSAAVAAAAAAALIVATPAADAFVIPSTCGPKLQTASVGLLPAQERSSVSVSSLVRLYADADMNSGSEEDDGGSKEDEKEGEDDAKAEAEEDGAEEEEEEEDPEVTELKSQIADLEAQIKKKRSDLFSVQDAADKYSKAGYARKVAEMDQIRKMRGVAFKSNEFTARAEAVKNFLPVLDDLKILDAKYENNDFAKSYKALRWDLNNAMTALGMTEYTAEVGTQADTSRFVAVEERFSDDYAKGMVMEPVEVGLEIEGNVMRMAECVVSLGSEAEAAKEKAEEEEEGGGDEESAAEDESSED